MGTIFQRKRKRTDGSQYLEETFCIRYYHPIKKYSVTENTGKKTFKAAKTLMLKRESQKENSEQISEPSAKKTTMAELLELLRDDYKQNGKKDLYSLERRLDLHLIPFFKNFRAVAVTASVVLEYRKQRQEAGAKPGTINRELSHLSKTFKLGQELGKIGHLPLIKRLAEKNRRKGFFEYAQFQLVYAHLPAPVKPIAELAWFTGMRAGELLSLKWEQVDLASCCIRLEETKNGDPREIHYAENLELKSLIDLQWERKLQIQANTRKQIDHLFFRDNGKPVKDFRVCWNKALKKAGIEGKRLFHDLRRTAIRNLTQAGVPRETAKLISGHETDAVFERYNIRDPKDTRAALGKVSRLSKNEYKSSTNDDFDATDSIQ